MNDFYNWFLNFSELIFVLGFVILAEKKRNQRRVTKAITSVIFPSYKLDDLYPIYFFLYVTNILEVVTWTVYKSSGCLRNEMIILETIGMSVPIQNSILRGFETIKKLRVSESADSLKDKGSTFPARNIQSNFGKN